MLKTVFASRLPGDEQIYQTINIKTIIEKHAGKIKDQEYIIPTYDVLCEVAHQNFIGRSIYIVDISENDHAGDRTYMLALNHGARTAMIEAVVVRALSWASMTHTTARLALQKSLGEFLALRANGLSVSAELS